MTSNFAVVLLSMTSADHDLPKSLLTTLNLISVTSKLLAGIQLIRHSSESEWYHTVINEDVRDDYNHDCNASRARPERSSVNA